MAARCNAYPIMIFACVVLPIGATASHAEVALYDDLVAPEAQEQYVTSVLSNIQGGRVKRGGGMIWHHGLFMRILSDAQRLRGMLGGVGEIGVHHGYFTIALFGSASTRDTLFAADIFEKQHLNVDNSGNGSKSIFLASNKKFGIEPSSISLFEGSSMWLEETPFKLRLISVDGGHTYRVTINDLLWFLDNALPDAIAIVDDYSNPVWPNVGLATNDLVRAGKLYPFLHTGPGHGKVYVTNNEQAAARYTAMLHGLSLCPNATAIAGRSAVCSVSDHLLAYNKRLKSVEWSRPIDPPASGPDTSLMTLYRHYGKKWLAYVKERATLQQRKVVFERLHRAQRQLVA
jgi:hypothetical protein